MSVDIGTVMQRINRDYEDFMFEVIERYERGEQPDPGQEYTEAEIIERYKRGCGCLYCGKSTIPDRSPERDVCTPADCARGLAEYLRRMED